MPAPQTLAERIAIYRILSEGIVVEPGSAQKPVNLPAFQCLTKKPAIRSTNNTTSQRRDVGSSRRSKREAAQMWARSWKNCTHRAGVAKDPEPHRLCAPIVQSPPPGEPIGGRAW
jgi:hypothetical protein